MNPTAYTDSGSIARREVPAAWLTPQLIVSLAPYSYKDYTIAPGVITQILGINNRRIGITLIISTATIDGTFVSPDGDPQTFGIPIPAATRIISFQVDDLLSLVAKSWYAYHASGATIRVIEFSRPV